MPEQQITDSYKDSIRQRIKKEILEGKIVPFPQDYRGIPKGEITNISDREFYAKSTDFTTAQQNFYFAMQGVRELWSYLGTNRLREPKIIFQHTHISEETPFSDFDRYLEDIEGDDTVVGLKVLSPRDLAALTSQVIIDSSQTDLALSEQDALNPTLPSYRVDNRIIVRPLKELGYRYKVQGQVSFSPEQTYGFSFFHYQTLSSKTGRGYRFPRDIPIAVERSPVLLATGQNMTINNHASLAIEVLATQLEPATSLRIVQNLLDYSTDRELTIKEVRDVATKKAGEESLIARALVKAWLLKTKDQRGFSLEDILAWNPRGDAGGTEEITELKRIQEIGPVNAIEEYFLISNA